VLHVLLSRPSIPSVIESVYVALRDLDQVAKVATDTLGCRVERLLRDMGSCRLLELPVDAAVGPDHFLQQAESSVRSAALALCW